MRRVGEGRSKRRKASLHILLVHLKLRVELMRMWIMECKDWTVHCIMEALSWKYNSLTTVH